MIDSEIIDSFDVEVRTALKQCVATLYSFGVVQRQIDREKERLLSGDKDESEVDLAKSILAYRSKHQQLLLLNELGKMYARELSYEDS